MPPTHEVLNQPPPLEHYDLFSTDRVLGEALEREGAGWAREHAQRVGVEAGGDALVWGRLANANPPILRTHDRFGNRIDEVEFHPAWHELLRLSVHHGLHALPWREPRPALTWRAPHSSSWSPRPRPDIGCPISMTYSAVPALRAQPELAAEWEPRILSNRLRRARATGGREDRARSSAWR